MDPPPLTAEQEETELMRAQSVMVGNRWVSRIEFADLVERGAGWLRKEVQPASAEPVGLFAKCQRPKRVEIATAHLPKELPYGVTFTDYFDSQYNRATYLRGIAAKMMDEAISEARLRAHEAHQQEAMLAEGSDGADGGHQAVPPPEGASATSESPDYGEPPMPA
eukprot:GHVU01006039.1.p1 GENE.GHVU01006039.1~~GHVU01006039.1.p1  ORF type:complete len:165 (+),score=28.99 GHVU01006039.1:1794-2288(+)